MPRQTTAISILLASPFDVKPERELISTIVIEWNNNRGRNLGVFFDLLKFETSVSAGFGEDGQDVVNDGIGNDYDAVIGIFWKRVGTPTPRSKSGAIEEIERAIARHHNGEKIEISVYFKNVAVLPDEIDLEQIQGVRDFKHRLELEGGLHKPFSDDATLRFEISILLDTLAKRFCTRSPTPAANKDSGSSSIKLMAIKSSEITGVHEDVGFFDVVENIVKSSSVATGFLIQLGSELNSLANTTSAQSTIISEIGSWGSIKLHEMKPIINIVEKSMDHFSNFVELKESEFKNSSAELAENTRSLLDLMYDFEPSNSEINDLILELSKLVDASSTSLDSLEGLHQTTRGLQRMTTAFNHSRKRILINFDAVISDIGSMRDIIAVAVSELSARHETNMKAIDSSTAKIGRADTT